MITYRYVLGFFLDDFIAPVMRSIASANIPKDRIIRHSSMRLNVLLCKSYRLLLGRKEFLLHSAPFRRHFADIIFVDHPVIGHRLRCFREFCLNYNTIRTTESKFHRLWLWIVHLCHPVGEERNSYYSHEKQDTKFLVHFYTSSIIYAIPTIIVVLVVIRVLIRHHHAFAP